MFGKPEESITARIVGGTVIVTLTMTPVSDVEEFRASDVTLDHQRPVGKSTVDFGAIPKRQTRTADFVFLRKGLKKGPLHSCVLGIAAKWQDGYQMDPETIAAYQVTL